MLETVGTLIFFSYGTACFIRFLDFCMSDNGVLSFYYKWLLRISHVKTALRDGQEVIINARWYYYPLGGCIHCMGFWIALLPAFYVCEAYAQSWQMYILLFAFYQGITFHFTEIQEK